MWVRVASSTASSGAGCVWLVQCQGSPGNGLSPSGRGVTQAPPPLQLSPTFGGGWGGEVGQYKSFSPSQVPADSAAGSPHPAVGLPWCCHGDRSPHRRCPTPGGFGPTAPSGPPDPRCCHPAALPPRAGGFSPIAMRLGGGSALLLVGGLREGLGCLRGSQCRCCGVWRCVGVLSYSAVGLRRVTGGLQVYFCMVWGCLGSGCGVQSHFWGPWE